MPWTLGPWGTLNRKLWGALNMMAVGYPNFNTVGYLEHEGHGAPQPCGTVGCPEHDGWGVPQPFGTVRHTDFLRPQLTLMLRALRCPGLPRLVPTGRQAYVGRGQRQKSDGGGGGHRLSLP